jgi:hypothetical protein
MMRMKGCFIGAAVLLGACAGADIQAQETHQPTFEEEDCGSPSSVGSVSIRCQPDTRVFPPAPAPAPAPTPPPPEMRPELRCVAVRGDNVLLFDPATEEPAETTKVVLGTGAFAGLDRRIIAMFGAKLLSCELGNVVVYDLSTGERSPLEKRCWGIAASTHGIWVQDPTTRELSHFLDERDLVANTPLTSVRLNSPEAILVGAGQTALWTLEASFGLGKVDPPSGLPTKVELEGPTATVSGLHESNGVIRCLDETMRLHRFDTASGKHLGVSKRVAPGWATAFACGIVKVPVKATSSP